MGRPPTSPGTWGKVRVNRDGAGWVADTLFRDWDGHSRRVRRGGATKAQAERALKDALRDRQHQGGGEDELTRDSPFTVAGRLWLAEVSRRERGTTYDRCHSRLHGRLVPALGELRVYEVTTQVCDRFLRSLTAPTGKGGAGLKPSTARGYRAALSGVMRYCVRMGVLTRNPVPDAAEIRGKGKRSRALTPAERVDLLAKLDGDPLAVQRDLPDLIRYMLGSGVRIGEALALTWGRVDLELGVVVHGETLVRETRTCLHCGRYRSEHPKPTRSCPEGPGRWEPGGGGLVLHEPKTAAGVRIIRLPEFVVTMLRIRWPGPGFEVAPVFPDASGGQWRDPINTVRMIRQWREPAGFPWFTSHVCRHTAITICNQAGVEDREITGHVGHNDIGFTRRTYMDLAQRSDAVPNALDAAYRAARR